MRNSSTKISRATLLTGAGSATLIAGVAGLKWNLTRLHFKSLVSAAQAITVEGNLSSKSYYKLPLSWPVEAFVEHEITAYDPSESGESLVITPSAAGPSIWAVAEYEVISV